jgi:polar amino acid transport system substrate-binding protein
MHRTRPPLALAVALIAAACVSIAPRGALAAPTSFDLIAPGLLLFGGDEEGGGPYVYPADDDPSRVVGFEVELADKLARELGLRASFFQGQWDKMPELLHTRKCDIVLNGYEWMPARLETMEASIPYYIYGLELLVRSDGDIGSWEDLEHPGPRGKRRVGVLGGSAAEKFANARWGERVDVAAYDGSTDAMREVETNKLDATIQDTPAAVFYRSRFPALRSVGPPVGRGYYVVYARKGNLGLVRALNEALMRLIERGELEALYRAYGIWDDAQHEVADIARVGKFYGQPSQPVDLTGAGERPDPRREVTASARKHGLDAVLAYAPILMQSAGLTVVLSCLSFPLAVIGGLFVALGRLYGPKWIKVPLAAYVEFLRGTPVMLQLYFIFFFLPEVGISVPAFWTAILGLALNYSAYESEIYRAGLSAIPRGQMEAALALGMSRPLALRRIIVPQAVRIVVPPVVNDFIALFKDTSVCSVVTLVELTKRFSILSQSTQSTVELMLLTGVLYMLMSYPLSLFSRRLENRLAPGLA